MSWWQQDRPNRHCDRKRAHILGHNHAHFGPWWSLAGVTTWLWAGVNALRLAFRQTVVAVVRPRSTFIGAAARAWMPA